MILYFYFKVYLIIPIFVITRSWNCVIDSIEMTLHFEIDKYLIIAIFIITRFKKPCDYIYWINFIFHNRNIHNHAVHGTAWLIYWNDFIFWFWNISYNCDIHNHAVHETMWIIIEVTLNFEFKLYLIIPIFMITQFMKPRD